jgi:hypothetical protein
MNQSYREAMQVLVSSAGPSPPDDFSNIDEHDYAQRNVMALHRPRV